MPAASRSVAPGREHLDGTSPMTAPSRSIVGCAAASAGSCVRACGGATQGGFGSTSFIVVWSMTRTSVSLSLRTVKPPPSHRSAAVRTSGRRRRRRRSRCTRPALPAKACPPAPPVPRRVPETDRTTTGAASSTHDNDPRRPRPSPSSSLGPFAGDDGSDVVVADVPQISTNPPNMAEQGLCGTDFRGRLRPSPRTAPPPPCMGRGRCLASPRLRSCPPRTGAPARGSELTTPSDPRHDARSGKFPTARAQGIASGWWSV